MIHKRILAIFFIIIMYLCNTHTVEFNPEEYNFSKAETIKSWLPDYLQNEQHILFLQNWITEAMPQNTAMLTNRATSIIKNNDNDTRYFGKNFPIMAIPQLAFLQTVRQYCMTHKKPAVVMEIGAGNGFFAYKIALALGNYGTCIINDLSEYEIKNIQALFGKMKQQIPLNNDNVIFDIGDAVSILDRCPNLEGTVNLCYVQNVEHFMNPIQHQSFLKTVLKFLAPGGKVFCTANTIYVGCGKKGNKYFDLYIDLKKKGVTYPMFLKTYQNIKQVIGTNAFIPGDNIKGVEVAADNEECYSRGRDTGNRENNLDYGLCGIVEQENLRNLFTPTIWLNAFKKAAESLPECCIEKEDGYFTNLRNEEKFCEFDNNQILTCASVVMKKIA